MYIMKKKRAAAIGMWSHMMMSIVYLYVSMIQFIAGEYGVGVFLSVMASTVIYLSFKYRKKYRAIKTILRDTMIPLFEIATCPTMRLSEIKARRFLIVDEVSLKERYIATEDHDKKIFEDMSKSDD